MTEGFAVPDAIEPLVGWRAWALARTMGGTLELRPIIYSGEIWPPHEVAPAKCPPHGGRAGHAPPQADCTCGFYAVDGLDRLPTVTGRDVTVIGSVALWGRLIEHESGIRAEFAYPERLRLVCGPCWQAGTFTPGVISIEVTSRGTLLALCERHANGPSESPDTVQPELLGTYAVDPMPDEVVDDVAAVWSHPTRRSKGPLVTRVSLVSAAMLVLFFGTFLALVALAMSVR
jgi:hypothetical protein